MQLQSHQGGVRKRRALNGLCTIPARREEAQREAGMKVAISRAVVKLSETLLCHEFDALAACLGWLFGFGVFVRRGSSATVGGLTWPGWLIQAVSFWCIPGDSFRRKPCAHWSGTLRRLQQRAIWSEQTILLISAASSSRDTLGIDSQQQKYDDGTSRAASHSGRSERQDAGSDSKTASCQSSAWRKRFDDSLTRRWLRRDKYPGWR
jgi:hypothetical protein